MGEISEDFYDGHNFPIYDDVDSLQYKLVSTAHNFTRPNVLYHPKVLQDKQKSIGIALFFTNRTKSKTHED